MSLCAPGPGHCQCLVGEKKVVPKCQRGSSFLDVPVLALRRSLPFSGQPLEEAFPLGPLCPADLRVSLMGDSLACFQRGVLIRELYIYVRSWVWVSLGLFGSPRGAGLTREGRLSVVLCRRGLF